MKFLIRWINVFCMINSHFKTLERDEIGAIFYYKINDNLGMESIYLMRKTADEFRWQLGKIDDKKVKAMEEKYER